MRRHLLNGVPPPNGYDDLRRKRLFGLDFVDTPTVAVVARTLLDFRPPTSSTMVLPVVITPNVDHMVILRADDLDPVVADVVQRAAWLLPDGQPIVWTSRLVSRPLSARLPGSELVEQLWPAVCREGIATMVVAPNTETADRVRLDHAGAIVVEAPRFQPHDAAALDDFAATCIASMDDAGVRFVFVAVGFPLSAAFAGSLLRQWPSDRPVPVVLCIGASFEMFHGLKRRAPIWMQRLGLEWFFRFIQEPRRLFGRYLLRDPRFAAQVWREWRTRNEIGAAEPEKGVP